MTNESGATAPLANIRILDLSRLLPGGACSRLLRDLGAEIIKVEHPREGDPVRSEPPFLSDDDSAVHQFLDAGKRSIVLDLKNPGDVNFALQLAGRSDAVLESFRPGVSRRLGIGPEHVANVNPATVYVSLTGYGQEGPRAGHAGHDINYSAYAGVWSTTGDQQGEPALSGVLVADMMGATLAATSILAGIVRAHSCGVGGHVDLALQEAASWALALPLTQHLVDGSAWFPGEGMLNGGLPCYRLYECKDGRHIAVGALEQPFWENLVRLIGRVDLSNRRTDPTAIDELTAVFLERTQQEWLELLEGRDTCVAPVKSLQEASIDQQGIHRGTTVDVKTDRWEQQQLACPIRFVDHQTRRQPAPDLGADGAWARGLVSLESKSEDA